MKYLIRIFTPLLLISLLGCSNGSNSDNSIAKSSPQFTSTSSHSSQAIQSSSTLAAASSSQASSNADLATLALQQNFKAQIEVALASGDQQTFLDLFYLEGVQAELIDMTRTLVLPAVLEESYESITFETTTETFENFDQNYRYTPNLNVIGQVVLVATPDAKSSSSFTFQYGLVDGEYRLAHSVRELMEYDGPRNTPIGYSVFGQSSTTPDRFHIIASYQVSGLTREIDTIIPAGNAHTFYGQYFNSITLDQVVGNDEFHLTVSEDNTVIFTSETKSNGESVSYIND